ncbi:hypothetical protein SKAU_G00296220 [Synaphobranchus kaupii]|uniref:MIF4G domain-containing protein n=1 Tax=Synaphobranchus kaupii TaxID=118154 RepID=A0A9Q1EUQ7_SYNKA|nr:hypothetical protein SKAU_G00296220 [Synaphobranchus kaupii]
MNSQDQRIQVCRSNITGDLPARILYSREELLQLRYSVTPPPDIPDEIRRREESDRNGTWKTIGHVPFKARNTWKPSMRKDRVEHHPKTATPSEMGIQQDRRIQVCRDNITGDLPARILYSREELLQLQYSVTPPPDIPDEIRRREQGDRNGTWRTISHVPFKARNTWKPSMRKDGVEHHPQTATVQSTETRKIIGGVSFSNDVRLHVVQNAWKPSNRKAKVEQDPEKTATQELFGQMRSILNKLTPERFEKLMKQVSGLSINTEDHLEGIGNMVFEKAIGEVKFTSTYANMCHYLKELTVPCLDPSFQLNFRLLMLHLCRKEFFRVNGDGKILEKELQDLNAANTEEESLHLKEELGAKVIAHRRRAVGTMKFLGELFKLNMVRDVVILGCVSTYLDTQSEEALECLCCLITTTGTALDCENVKPQMDRYFSQLNQILKEGKSTSRVRFMLQDVMDLRQNNWVPSRYEQGPKIISQVHEEAELEILLGKMQLLSISTELAQAEQVQSTISTKLAQAEQVQCSTISTPMNNWVPRRYEQGPKIISQVHEEAELEILLGKMQLLSISTELAQAEQVQSIIATELAQAEQVQSTISTELAQAEQVQSTIFTPMVHEEAELEILLGKMQLLSISTELAQAEQVQSTIATELAQAEQVQITISTELAVAEQVQSTITELAQAEQVQTTISTKLALAEQVQSTITELAQAEQVQSTIATELAQAEQVKSTITELAQAEQVQSTISTELAQAEQVQTTISTELAQAEQVQTTIATELALAEQVQSTITELAQAEQVQSTIATELAQAEQVKSTITELAQAEQVQSTISTELAQAEQVQTTISTELAQAEQVQTTIATELALAEQVQSTITEFAQAEQVQTTISTELAQAEQVQSTITELAQAEQVQSTIATELAQAEQVQSTIATKLAQAEQVKSTITELAQAEQVQTTISTELGQAEQVQTTITELAQAEQVQSTISTELAQAEQVQTTISTELGQAEQVQTTISTELAQASRDQRTIYTPMVQGTETLKIISNVSFSHDVKLHVVQNAWRPSFRQAKVDQDPEMTVTQELFRRMRSILNKVTPEMFEQLVKQVAELQMDTTERLQGVVDIIFEKAICEPKFASTYARMCHCLKELHAPINDCPEVTLHFQQAILHRCWMQFNERAEEEANVTAQRRRSIGNMTFLSELFKLEMAEEYFMHRCITTLLDSQEEALLECLCCLLSTIGSKLDCDKAKCHMDKYTRQMEQILKAGKTSSRISFMVKDIMDLRQNNWVPRNSDQGPKTIRQVHKQAELESKATVKTSVATVGKSKATVKTSVGTVGKSKATVKTSVGTVGKSKATVKTSVGTVGNSKATVGNTVGTMGNSKATVKTSVATVGKSKATVKTSIGTVGNSKATVKTSVGTVGNSKATVKTSVGTVGNIVGTMGNNKTTVKDSGTMENSEATVDNNSGTVLNVRATEKRNVQAVGGHTLLGDTVPNSRMRASKLRNLNSTPPSTLAKSRHFSLPELFEIIGTVWTAAVVKDNRELPRKILHRLFPPIPRKIRNGTERSSRMAH